LPSRQTAVLNKLLGEEAGDRALVERGIDSTL
jgi:hypothetical protein